jgi:serine/threonine protein kinase
MHPHPLAIPSTLSSVHPSILSMTLRNPQTTYTEKEARDLFRVLVGAIEYLHACNVVHRDIKVRVLFVGCVPAGDLLLVPWLK